MILGLCSQLLVDKYRHTLRDLCDSIHWPKIGQAAPKMPETVELHLPEDLPEVWETLMFWKITGQMPQPIGYAVIFRCWIFGDKYGMPEFQDAAMILLLKHWDKHDYKQSIPESFFSQTVEAYSALKDGPSQLKTLLAEEAVKSNWGDDCQCDVRRAGVTADAVCGNCSEYLKMHGPVLASIGEKRAAELLTNLREAKHVLEKSIAKGSKALYERFKTDPRHHRLWMSYMVSVRLGSMEHLFDDGILV